NISAITPIMPPTDWLPPPLPPLWPPPPNRLFFRFLKIWSKSGGPCGPFPPPPPLQGSRGFCPPGSFHAILFSLYRVRTTKVEVKRRCTPIITPSEPPHRVLLNLHYEVNGQSVLDSLAHVLIKSHHFVLFLQELRQLHVIVPVIDLQSRANRS